MILLELSAIFAAMMGVLLIELAKAWQLHREANRRPTHDAAGREPQATKGN